MARPRKAGGKQKHRNRQILAGTVSPDLDAYVRANVAKGLSGSISEELEECIISRMYVLGDLKAGDDVEEVPDAP